MIAAAKTDLTRMGLPSAEFHADPFVPSGNT
jgi:hypothetical protein